MLEMDIDPSIGSIRDLIEEFGSQRRVFEAYWHGQLPEEFEKFVEDAYPPEIRIGYKPLA